MPVAILFADICDSMPLYEETGDASALAVIAQCLDALAGLATRFGGTVIRSKGDDLLCIFETPAHALDAAAGMLDFRAPGIPAIHVGIHFGPVIRARQDIYGDAVNVAARMLALAKPGEMLATRELVDALPHVDRDRLALLGRRVIKGKQDAIQIYSMVPGEGVATQILSERGAHPEPASPLTVMPTVVIDLDFRGQVLTVHDGHRCLIGRSEDCDLVVPDPRVSREHAWVDVQGGRARLIDQSSTGSWILDSEGGHKTLRRESGELSWRGSIRLALHPRERKPAPEIDFWLRATV